MLEKQLALDFTKIFTGYQIWVPNNRTAGWPDRGVQIDNSRIVWFELKVITSRMGTNLITISELTNQQAAWLAKWQREGGHCYLFLGLVDINDKLSSYAVLRVGDWRIWPQVPNRKISKDQLILFDNKQEVIKWFTSIFPKDEQEHYDRLIDIVKKMCMRMSVNTTARSEFWKFIGGKTDLELKQIMSACNSNNEDAIQTYLVRWANKNNISVTDYKNNSSE